MSQHRFAARGRPAALATRIPGDSFAMLAALALGARLALRAVIGLGARLALRAVIGIGARLVLPAVIGLGARLVLPAVVVLGAAALPAAGLAADVPSIAGIWLPDASRSQRFPANPPYTTEGRRLVEDWRATHDPIEDDPGRFCQAPGMPSLALGGADYPVEIIVTPAQVTLLMELHQQVRRVFLNESEHPARPFPQRNGHSIGRWDGDTLVVDTAALTAITFGSVPHSERMHVVERIRAIDDGAALVNEVTIVDPVMYAEPVVVEQYYSAAPPGTRMLEYECTEGMWLDHEASRREAAAQAAAPAAEGIYNWIRTTGDAESSYAFYAQVFGLELARSTFAGPAPADAPAPRILPVAEARSDRLVWNLTDTEGARFRTVFMHAPNTPFGLELSEFFDLPRLERPPNPWDPGASMTIFAVRDLAAIRARLEAAAAPIVTLGGDPLATPDGRSILVRDPDGSLVLAVQASRADIAAAAAGDVIGTSIGITVADTAAALHFYRDLLGFDVGASRQADARELRVLGLSSGGLVQTSTTIPGTQVDVVLFEFELPENARGMAAPHPYRWRIQDVGAPQFQLQVSGLDGLLERTAAAGFRFISRGGEPIDRAFGRFVFAVDADGIPVEYVEPAGDRSARPGSGR